MALNYWNNWLSNTGMVAPKVRTGGSKIAGRISIFDPDTDHNNGNEIPCLIWYHLGQYTGHASEGLTRDEWEVLKS